MNTTDGGVPARVGFTGTLYESVNEPEFSLTAHFDALDNDVAAYDPLAPLVPAVNANTPDPEPPPASSDRPDDAMTGGDTDNPTGAAATTVDNVCATGSNDVATGDCTWQAGRLGVVNAHWGS